MSDYIHAGMVGLPPGGEFRPTAFALGVPGQIKPALCENCKHWEGPPGYPLGRSNGYCERPNIIEMVWESDGESSMIVTTNNFGCVLFEQRPE